MVIIREGLAVFLEEEVCNVDSAGDVHACPFCHTKSYNIIQLIRSNQKKLPPKETSCPRYEKIA